ncbi:MAG: hypothetical protein RL011_1069 [Pseudomonadota bacterium]
MFENASQIWTNLASIAGIFVTGFGLYEVLTSLGPAEVAIASIEGATKTYQLTVLKGFFRRRLNAQSIVRFADGTGMYFPNGRRFHRDQIGFDVDVVFLDGKLSIVSIHPGGRAASKSVVDRKASSLFICNRGEADALQPGQKLRLQPALS